MTSKNKDDMKQNTFFSKNAIKWQLLTCIFIFQVFYACSGNNSSSSNTTNDAAKTDTTDKDKPKKLKLNSKIVLSKRAQCQMDCDKITMEQVKEVLSKGKINPKKSDTKKKPCPILVLESSEKDKRPLRIAISACKDQTKILFIDDISSNNNTSDCHKKCK